MKRIMSALAAVAALAAAMVVAAPAAVSVPVGLDGGTQPNTAADAGVPVNSRNMEWVTGLPQVAGSDIEFLERKETGGGLSRYAIVGNIGGGFQIIDITDPTAPSPVSFYASPHGYQGDIQVNPRRNIVVFSTDIDGSVAHGGGSGIELVDITNLDSPERLSVVSGIGGAHNSTIIDDDYIYTALPTHIIDYSDAENPRDLGDPPFNICGHDITLDPNKPDRVYSACSGSSTMQIIDVSDPADPELVGRVRDNHVATAHQVDPSPDSSLLVLTDERGGGVSHFRCPGGGAHIYDISGKYSEPNENGPASEANPIKIGTWFPPFTGLADDGNAGQWGNCTMHNMTFQAERFLLSAGWYSAGAWVTDLQAPPDGDGDPYAEYSGNDPQVQGTTTWGNTQGNIMFPGDEVWSTKWSRFDDPDFDRYAFSSGMTHGFDVLRYTGDLPKKVARLTVDGAATDGTISGTLDRYAVWTYEGWVNKPLAGQTVTVTVDGETAGTVTTEGDGTFSVTVDDLDPGEHAVTVSWEGNVDYQPNTLTQTVTS